MTPSEIRAHGGLPVQITGELARYFGRPADPLVFVGGALTTYPIFAVFGESLGHMGEDGNIRRHGRVIGSIDDCIPLETAAPSQ